MKLLLQEQRPRFFIISKKREKRNRISKEKKLRKNREKSGRSFREINKITYRTFFGPEELGCRSSNSMDCLISWLSKLRETTINKNTPVFIDFQKSTNAESVGFILLQSEIDRIQSIKGSHFIRGNSPQDSVAAQVFLQVGLSSLLGSKKNVPIIDKNVVYWRHTHGTKIDSDKAGKLLVQIATDHNLDDSIINLLYDGVTEAITNSVMHAYPDNGITRRYYGDKKWWMFTGINEETLHVIVCDLGIGIPNSLKFNHPELIDIIKSFLKSGNHSRLIEVAMEKGRSRSEKPHRGLGMVELKNLINFTHKGKLGIFSQKGVYIYGGDGQENIEGSRNSKNSIMGTVVAWSVPLDVLASIGSELDERKDN